jgi:hypothetical protein
MEESSLRNLGSSFRTRNDPESFSDRAGAKNEMRPRNDRGRIAKAALRDWQDTIAALRLCNRS